MENAGAFWKDFLRISEAEGPRAEGPAASNVQVPHVCSQEAARYLETYKAYEVKSAESIQERVSNRKARIDVCWVLRGLSCCQAMQPCGYQLHLRLPLHLECVD